MNRLTVKRYLLPLLFYATVLLTACNSQDTDSMASQATPVGTLVMVAEVVQRDVPVTFETVGAIMSRTDPTVSAEIAGRVLRLGVDASDAVVAGELLVELDTTALELEKQASKADIKSLIAQIDNEERRVRRYQGLQKKAFLSETKLEDSMAQLAILRAKLEAAQARIEIVQDRLNKTRVKAPVSGLVERRFVSVGDYVKPGDPLFHIAGNNELRAFLPFPETVGHRLRPGLEVSLVSPLAPATELKATIVELLPEVGPANRAVTAIVDFRNPGGWRPGGTVAARVVVERRQEALLVPDTSIVRRPIGSVVYVIRDGRAEARKVALGIYLDDWVEVVQGLDGSETIAVDGASYLTDGSPIRIVEG